MAHAGRCSSPERPPGPLNLDQLLTELGIQVDPQLFERARVHRSYSYENGSIPNNERLEFLGDSVLGVIVTEYLYRTYPELPEGRLAKLRAAVVSATALAGVARDLNLGEHLMLGRGELSTGGRDKSSILADTMEALIAVVFLSGGMEAAERFVHHLFDPLVTTAATLGAGLDWKTSLQEICALNSWPAPVYEFESTGPEHDKRFQSFVVVDGRRFGPGHGRNKKQAEQEAAALAFDALRAAPADGADA